MRRRTTLNLMVIVALLFGLLPLPSASAAPELLQSAPAPANQPAASAPDAQTLSTIEVEPQLKAQIAANGSTGYLIYFRERPDLSDAAKMSWSERGWFVMQALQKTAADSQTRVLAYLDSQGAKYEKYWIDNLIAVSQSTQSTFSGLMGFSEIAALRTRRTLSIIEPEAQGGEVNFSFAIEPNISHVNAPSAWALGFNGAGSVVANIDTGVRYTHQALVSHYRGNLGGGSFDHNYNWWDPYGDHPTSPADDNGHGSHTMGTMVGDDGSANQIGMAPGAEWMACRGCNTSSCTDAALLTCAQWVAAPWNLSQANPDPDKRPFAVNNSWGDCSTAYDGWYQGVVDSWQAAGIYPVFSNGNASNCGLSEPPPIGSVGNPGRYSNVTGVGSSGQSNGQYATHSLRGPTDNLDTINPNGYPSIKPQVVAPGVNIRSSVNTSDTSYEGGWSGTSMSAPHVTALVALMWEAGSCLRGDYAQTETLIEQTATPITTGLPADNPPGEGPGKYPNQSTGWGEINALAAVEAAAGFCGDSGLEGQITQAAAPGTPIVGATVQASSTPTDTRTAVTDATGHYSFRVFAGTYTVTAQAYGYLPQTASGVAVSMGVTTTQNLALDPAPTYVVSGTLTDATTGWPLYGKITIGGYPGAPIWTDPVTGFYSVTLLAGSAFEFNATAFSAGYTAAVQSVGPLTGNATVSLGLNVDAVACVAPGYWLDVTGVFEPFNGTTVPAGWTVTSSGSCPWTFNDPGANGNLTGGAGNFAGADSDFCGIGTTMSTTLTSPTFDVSTLGVVNLSFNYDYNNLSSSEVAAVDVSADNGATWSTISTWNTDQRGPALFSQDVTSVLSGATQAKLRYRYVAPGWDWWWQVDNAFIGEKKCLPRSGGLVVGNVSDANNGTALNGAVVSDQGGYTTAAVTTPSDPKVGDGYYTLFSPAGSQTITATAVKYAPGVAVASVPLSGTLRQDFNLGAGILGYTPSGITVSLAAGQAVDVPVTVTNSGNLTLTYSLAEIDLGNVPYGSAAVNADVVPWLSESPVSGTVAAAASRPVTVTASTVGIQPGVYQAALRFNNDTPYAVSDLPVTLNVTVPPSWGKLAGSVSTLGYCDASPSALAGVTVTIQSVTQTWKLLTDNSGAYATWLDQSYSPLTATVNIVGYESAQIMGINIVGQTTTTNDFSVRWLKPCLTINPSAVAATLSLGQSTTRPFRLMNAGAASTVYSMTEQPISSPTATSEVQLRAGTNPAAISASPVRNSSPAAPWVPTGNVGLAVDDGSAEDSIGLTAGGQFVWLNRFTPAAGSYPFTLEQVSVLFPTTTPTGSAMQIVIWEDKDGDGNPGTGAHFLYSQDVTVQTNDQTTWNVYNLTTPVLLTGPGDVLIGLVNRGATAVGQYPASIDQSSTSQRRSWIGIYLAGNPPNPPTLPADDSWGIIDDLSADLAGNWTLRGSGHTSGAGSDVVWLSETPVTGTVAADSFLNTTINFDANAVAVPGTYQALVNVNSYDPQNAQRAASVTMNVTAPASWGVLTGTVSSLGYCDVNSAPLKGASIVLQAANGLTRTIATDANGRYTLWLNSLTNPYTLTVTAANYVGSNPVGGITVAPLGAVTNAPAVNLRSIAPCVDYAPDGLSVTVPWQGSASQTLTLTNSGAASSLFTVTEQTGGFFPLAQNVNPILVVNNLAVVTLAYTQALTNLGYAYVITTPTGFDANAVPALLGYSAVFWAGNPTSTYHPKLAAYLDAGGRFFIAYEDFGFSHSATGFYRGYFEVSYGTDSGSDGPLTGADILLGVDPDVSSGTWQDNFTITGTNAVGILVNTAPRTGLAGLRIARNAYKAVYLGFNLNNVGLSTAGDALESTIVQKSLTWLLATGPTDVVPWLAETPDTGTLATDTGTQAVTVDFNANVAAITQPGTYYAKLNVKTDDSSLSSFLVPVTMTVVPTDTQGRLSGVVSSLGYCDVNPVPVNGASLIVQNSLGVTHTLTTNASGVYQEWLSAGAYTVTANTAGHLLAVASDLVTGTMTTTLNLNLRLNQPCVGTSPTAGLSANLTMGVSTTLPMTISNRGALATTFSLIESAGGFIPTSPQAGGDVLIVNEIAADVTAMKTALTALGYSYDEVTSSVYTGMTVNSLLAYRAVLYAGVISSGSEQAQTIAYLDAGGKLFLASEDEGYFYSSSVFYSTYLEASYILDDGSQGTITGHDIMAGVNTSIVAAPFPDNFNIIGANAVSIFSNDTPNTDQAGLRIARNNYRAVYLAWNFNDTNGTADTATKQTVLGKALSWLAPVVDVPWLDKAPTSGNLAADTGLQGITVTMDASQVNQPGIYYASLQVKSNDPVNQMANVPVTMTVSAPADWGKLTGVVNGLAACDVTPTPMPNAVVYVESSSGMTWTLNTDVNGVYKVWMLATSSPLTVTASNEAGYEAQTVSGVSVTAQHTTTQDLNLRPYLPCAGTYVPSPLITIQNVNQLVTKTLTISNTGAGLMNWNFTERVSAGAAVAEERKPSGPATSKSAPQSGPASASAVPSSPYDTLLSEGFEDDLIPPAGWQTVSNSSSTRKWTTVDIVTYPDFVHTGAFAGWVNYDSANTQDEWLISPPIAVVAGSPTSVSFWALSDTEFPGATMTLYAIDAGGTFTDTLWDLVADETWTTFVYRQVTENLSAYQGKTIRLAWHYHGLDGDSFGLDDILVTGPTAGSCSPNALPWVSVVPVSGTTTASGSSLVEVVFDSTGMAPGSYSGNLCLNTNDPSQPKIEVPVATTIGAELTLVYHDLEDIIHMGETLFAAGEFNGWNTTATPMTGNADNSVFTATVSTNQTSLQFKYIVYTDTAHSGPVNWNWLQSHSRVVTMTGDMTADHYRNIEPSEYVLQWPFATSTVVGVSTENIYGQIGADDLTYRGAGRGLMAELGYGMTADAASWAWQPMAWGSQAGNRVEFVSSIVPTATGTYSYVVRYNGNWGVGNPYSTWSYGDKNGNTPFSTAEAGVLTVGERRGVSLSPAVNMLLGKKGAVVTHTLQITNTGSTTDTFGLTATGNTWAVNLSTTSITLGAGQSVAFYVFANIPPEVETSDTVTVKVASAADVAKQATAALTTAVKYYFNFMPLILR